MSLGTLILEKVTKGAKGLSFGKVRPHFVFLQSIMQSVRLTGRTVLAWWKEKFNAMNYLSLKGVSQETQVNFRRWFLREKEWSKWCQGRPRNLKFHDSLSCFFSCGRQSHLLNSLSFGNLPIFRVLQTTSGLPRWQFLNLSIIITTAVILFLQRPCTRSFTLQILIFCGTSLLKKLWFTLQSCYPLFYFETILDFLESSFEVLYHLLNPAGSHALLWVSEIIYSLCLF